MFSSLPDTNDLNELFGYDLELCTPDERNTIYGPAADFDKKTLEGTGVMTRIELDGSGIGLQSGTGAGTCETTGIVTRVCSPHLVGRHIAYRLTLRPWPRLVTLCSGYKIYQEMNVIQILDALLGNYIYPVEKCLDVWRYPKRVFQQQYGETDSAYLQHLAQEWGTSQFMAYSGRWQCLVLTDSSSASGPCSSVAYHTIRRQATRHRIDEEHAHEFRLIDQLVSGEQHTLDHDFGKPRADPSIRNLGPRETAHPTYSLYEYPDDHSQPATGSDSWDEDRFIARIRMEEIRQHGLRGKGNGNLCAMVSGCTFHLVGFLEQEANREYLIFGTKPRIEDVGETTGTGQQWRREVEFKVQPTNEIFRPVRTQHKPRMSGPIQARVAGPAGHPTHTDQYGRIRVQMPYDLCGNNDEHSSCWVHVANAWAGNRFDAMRLPRVG